MAHELITLNNETHMPQVTVKDRLTELCFDPVRQAVAIAKGEELTQDHPFLALLRSWIDDMADAMEQDPSHCLNPKTYDDLLAMGEKFLTDSWVSHDLRYKQTKDLIEYVHPKQSATKSDDLDGRAGESKEVEPLTRAEVELFNDVFSAAY